MSIKKNYLGIVRNLGVGKYYPTKKGVNRSLVDSILKGCDIKVVSAKKISKALGVSLDELIGDNVKETHTDIDYKLGRKDIEGIRKVREIMQSGNNEVIESLRLIINVLHKMAK